MFRKMRRDRQLLPEEESAMVLRRGSSGVLAVRGDEGYPYAVPLNYVYQDSKIYFHCAMAGHKIDAIRGDDKVSFCVIDRDEVIPERFTTAYRSVIAFGRARIMETDGEKRAAIELLAAKYSPRDEAGRSREIEKDWDQLCMVEMTIEHMTGKEGLELLKKREE